MRTPKLPCLLMLLLLVMAFSVAAWVEPRYQARQRAESRDMMSFLLGDSRKLFANHFFVKADVYFHSGFYPTIFDNQESFKTPHMAEDAGALKGHNEGDETAFIGPPRDFIEAFGRHFFPPSGAYASGRGRRAGDRMEGPGTWVKRAVKSGKSCRGSKIPAELGPEPD